MVFVHSPPEHSSDYERKLWEQAKKQKNVAVFSAIGLAVVFLVIG